MVIRSWCADVPLTNYVSSLSRSLNADESRIAYVFFVRKRQIGRESPKATTAKQVGWFLWSLSSDVLVSIAAIDGMTCSETALTANSHLRSTTQLNCRDCRWQCNDVISIVTSRCCAQTTRRLLAWLSSWVELSRRRRCDLAISRPTTGQLQLEATSEAISEY